MAGIDLNPVVRGSPSEAKTYAQTLHGREGGGQERLGTAWQVEDERGPRPRGRKPSEDSRRGGLRWRIWGGRGEKLRWAGAGFGGRGWGFEGHREGFRDLSPGPWGGWGRLQVRPSAGYVRHPSCGICFWNPGWTSVLEWLERPGALSSPLCLFLQSFI